MRTTYLSLTVCIVLLSAVMLNSCDDTEKSPSPVIKSFTPVSDGVDVTVTIKGKNFGTSISHAVVDFNGTAAVINNLNDTLITTHVPSGATTGKIKVTVNGKSTLSQDDFVVLSGRWEQKANFPGDFRFYGIGFSVGNKGYVCSGINSPVVLSDLYEYDPNLDQWTKKADIPGARYFNTAFVVNGKAYVGLGRDSDGKDLGDFYEYDPSTDQWSPIATFPGGPRNSAIGFSIGTKGYVGLGLNYEAIPYVGYYDLWEYDPSADKWTQMADFPGKNGHGMTIGLAVDGKAYVGLSEFNNDWWQYDPIANSWTSLASFAEGSSFLIDNVGFTSHGKIYILGGYTAQCWEYDPSLDTWQQRTSIPEVSGGSYTFTIGDDGYITTDYLPQPNKLWKFSAN